MKRGIIAAPGIIEPSAEGFSVKPSLTAEDIRFFILYWDKVIIPTNNIVHFGFVDEDDLVGCGAIWRPRVQHQGKITGMEILKGQCEVAAAMMKDKSTDWVIHQTGNQFHIPEESATLRNVIRINLAGSLPVPSQDININEILEFKERRSDELRVLHSTLDEIYLEVLSSPDSNLANLKAVEKLRDDIRNLNKVSAEIFKSDKKFDLSTEFNVVGKDVVLALAGGAYLDTLIGVSSFPIAAAIATLASTIKISFKASKTFTHIGTTSKLSYLSRASREDILS